MHLLLLLSLILPSNDFERPMAAFGSGHRGIDMQISEVRTPASGKVSFVGKVFNRELITIQTDYGKFSFEPVCSSLEKLQEVKAGDIIGSRCENNGYQSHCEGCVHVSFRDQRGYLNPLWVLGLRAPATPVSGPGMGLRISLTQSLN